MRFVLSFVLVGYLNRLQFYFLFQITGNSSVYTTANRSNAIQSSVIKMEMGNDAQSRNAWLPQHLRMPISMYLFYFILFM